jgi:hypothetical protein
VKPRGVCRQIKHSDVFLQRRPRCRGFRSPIRTIERPRASSRITDRGAWRVGPLTRKFVRSSPPSGTTRRNSVMLLSGRAAAILANVRISVPWRCPHAASHQPYPGNRNVGSSPWNHRTPATNESEHFDCSGGGVPRPPGSGGPDRSWLAPVDTDRDRSEPGTSRACTRQFGRMSGMPWGTRHPPLRPDLAGWRSRRSSRAMVPGLMFR